MKNNNNTFIVSYIFKAPVISLWMQSGCGQITLTLWSDRPGCVIWCLDDLTCDPQDLAELQTAILCVVLE